MKVNLILIGLLTTVLIFGQDPNTIDFINAAKYIDFSDLWTLDKFQIEDDTITVERQEPLGFIGENYQRFHIHFSSLIKNPNDSLEYYVYGKTKVKSNICSFQGKMNVYVSGIYRKPELSSVKQGFIKGYFEFFEDSDQSGTGIIRGKYQTNFYIDSLGKLKYDALMWLADGFNNNQFEGTWIGYKTGNIKKCNWGDYRIPDSNGLDIGVAEFSPSPDYHSHDWLSYILQHKMPNSAIVNEPIKGELVDKWWMDNE